MTAPDLSSKESAEAYAQRLQRIWVPGDVLGGRLTWNHADNQFYLWYSFDFKSSNDHVDFYIEVDGNWNERSQCQLTHVADYYSKFSFMRSNVRWTPGKDAYYHVLASEHKFGTEAREQRMDYFRRGCFLSHIPLECSAHEKAEWKLWFDEQEKGELPQWSPPA